MKPASDKPEIYNYQCQSMVRVNYSQIDRMDFVYYANYLVWFEIGRTDFLREQGLNYKDVEDKGILLPVIRSECNYISPARYDDVLIIKTKINEIKKASMSFEYEVIRQADNKLIANGLTKHVFLDKNGKILRIGEDLFNNLH